MHLLLLHGQLFQEFSPGQSEPFHQGMQNPVISRYFEVLSNIINDTEKTNYSEVDIHSAKFD